MVENASIFTANNLEIWTDSQNVYMYHLDIYYLAFVYLT